MEYKTLHYKRIYNIGDYNSHQIEATVELGPGENPEEQMLVLIASVEKAIVIHEARKREPVPFE